MLPLELPRPEQLMLRVHIVNAIHMQSLRILFLLVSYSLTLFLTLQGAAFFVNQFSLSCYLPSISLFASVLYFFTSLSQLSQKVSVSRSLLIHLYFHHSHPLSLSQLLYNMQSGLNLSQQLCHALSC